MGNDGELIRELIVRWARAVHEGRIDAVVEDRAEDVVMFDVPPPYEGVRGIDAYREVWPPFFAWQDQGAVFDVEELEVTAGQDVAFAHALVRCGTEEELAARPGFRLRLTLGLRKEAGRWVVAHEHHSFPDLSGPDPREEEAEARVRAVHEHWFERTAAKDLEGLMRHIADDVVSYEHDAPLQYGGARPGARGVPAGAGIGAGDRHLGGPRHAGADPRRPRRRLGPQPHDRPGGRRHGLGVLVPGHPGAPAP